MDIVFGFVGNGYTMVVADRAAIRSIVRFHDTEDKVCGLFNLTNLALTLWFRFILLVKESWLLCKLWPVQVLPVIDLGFANSSSAMLNYTLCKREFRSRRKPLPISLGNAIFFMKCRLI